MLTKTQIAGNLSVLKPCILADTTSYEIIIQGYKAQTRSCVTTV